MKTSKNCPRCEEPMEYSKFKTNPKLERWYCSNVKCIQFWVRNESY